MIDLIAIFFTVGLVYTIYTRIKKRELNKVAVGRKVVLNYSDHNAIIESELPKTGTIDRMIRIGKTSDNFLINLSEPIVYKNTTFIKIVVRERLLGHYIGSNKDTEVHLLLPRNPTIIDHDKWDSFDHVAWLTIRLQ